MSLETEVKNLISAISVLTNLIIAFHDEQAGVNDDIAPEPPKKKYGAASQKTDMYTQTKPEPKPEEPDTAADEPELVTLDELRDALVNFRENKGAAKTKEILVEMGYKKLSEIPLTEGAAVIAKLKESA